MNENKMKDSKGIAALMRLIRPKQWIKNGFIFVPLFFGGALFHIRCLAGWTDYLLCLQLCCIEHLLLQRHL